MGTNRRVTIVVYSQHVLIYVRESTKEVQVLIHTSIFGMFTKRYESIVYNRILSILMYAIYSKFLIHQYDLIRLNGRHFIGSIIQ